MRLNSSEVPVPWLNVTTWPLIRSSGLGMSCFTMIFGAVSNLTALGILANSRVRFRRQSKSSFLLLTVALLLADLGGHVILGAFAMYLHMGQRYRTRIVKPDEAFCQIFGATMVFFGLSPLLLSCAMAIERCVAITQPFFHAATITVGHMLGVVLFLSSFALLLAVFAIGTYTTQFPGTWCFLPIHRPQSAADTALVLAFSCLGLTALTLSLLCNILSGFTLLQARIKSQSVNTKPAARRASSTSSASLLFSLDVEMMVQLAVLTVVSCVCWSPFLIRILQMQLTQSPDDSAHKPYEVILVGLRMASWNQILDPWVYILLRRAVLYSVCCAFDTQKYVATAHSSFCLRRTSLQ